MLNIQLLLTGDELMSGDIVDSNSAMIAQELANIGLAIKKKVTVADDIQDLIGEIERLSSNADVLIINGGLGPTIDDLTAEALSQVSSKPIAQHPDALAHITQWCEKRGFALNKPNLKQTMLPSGCSIIANAIGSAVGFGLVHNNCHIYCTPGVPAELKKMVRDEIIPMLKKQSPDTSHHHVTRFQVFGVGESSLQKIVDEELPDWPDDIELGFRASMPLLELKLTTKTTKALASKALWIEKISHLLGDHLVAEIVDGPKPFGEHVQLLLKEQGKKVTFAESCTGGMIASNMTRVAGSSAVFDGSFVTYANQQKTDMVNVSPETLNKHGAVSQQVVIEMAKGALAKTGADIAVAVSGVAGPDGGTGEKPVGTVWFAWGDTTEIKTVCLLLPGNRYYFQHYATAVALDLVRRKLIKSKQEPRYVKERRKT
ncbi:CinA family nicotinamide mononucleotide deamidase-related protein [Thalassotalea euphylliae]|uniref:CinA family nicotinamide mononucleotide deamidase-related protein n=1 Tax=Thalassotalea euphylliae TaxID=1655234 RepID=UPI00363D9D13